MPIPTTRTQLLTDLSTSFRKLSEELDAAGAGVGKLACVDDWTIKDLLAVRLWWSASVAQWIEAGRGKDKPITPAEGFRWRDTPALNAQTVRRAKQRPYGLIRQELTAAYQRIHVTIASLTDRELLTPHIFDWAGPYPVARWISINATRQYTTARTQIRKALRA